MFVNYIDKIAHVGSADDFDWVSTVRSYERLKQVTIEQNGDVYQYGFELKKPQNYCPSFQLERTVSYGLLANMFKYLIGSYILGQPNFYISNLDNYGLRDKIGTMLSIARKFSYFVRIEVCEDELEYVNLLHQSIFWLKLKSIGEKEQEKINLPILFVYQAEEQIPAWLAFKRRNFRANSLLSNFRFTLLLALSHYEK